MFAEAITSSDAVVTVTHPSGVLPVGASVEIVDAGSVPTLPGDLLGSIYEVSWTISVDGAPLDPPLQVDVSIEALLSQGVDPSLLVVVALNGDGEWRPVPVQLSADGRSVIVSVSVTTTFTVLQLAGALSAELPPSGGTVASADGATVTVPDGAASGPLLVSLVPTTLPDVEIPGDGQIVGTALAWRQEDPAIGGAIGLAEPATLSIPLPADADPSSSCPQNCDIVAYGQPPSGGPLTPLPTRLSADGSRVEVEVNVNVNVVLVTGAALVSGEIAPGESGALVTSDGSSRFTAIPGPAALRATVAPVAPQDEVTVQLSGELATTPRRVESGALDGRQASLEIPLADIQTGADPTTLRAYAVESGTDADAATPRLLPSVVDEAGGTLRIAINVSVTVYITAGGPTDDVRLDSGWNAVTFHGADGTPMAFLDAGLQDRITIITRWNAADGTYDLYYPTAPAISTLSHLNSEDALWVLVSEGPPVPWTQPADPPPPRGVLLFPGWNFVSWSGPAIASGDLFAPLQEVLRSAFVWVRPEDRLHLALPVVGPPNPITVQPRDGMWLLVGGADPVLWSQPGIEAG